MNSKQPARYIKRRMGNTLKMYILAREGIILDGEEQAIVKANQPVIINCPRCNFVNSKETRFCSKCSYPLIPAAYDEVKAAEQKQIQEINNKYEQTQSQVRLILSALAKMDDSAKTAFARQLFQNGGCEIE